MASSGRHTQNPNVKNVKKVGARRNSSVFDAKTSSAAKDKCVEQSSDSKQKHIGEFMKTRAASISKNKGDESSNQQTQASAAVIASPEQDTESPDRSCDRTENSREAGSTVTLEDIMDKLCTNGNQISKLTQMIEELKGAVFDLQTENDSLRREMEERKKREEELDETLEETRFQVKWLERKLNEKDQYDRRNNCRIYGVPEDKDQEEGGCERAVMSIFAKKLNLNINNKDIEACHRLGRKTEGRSSPRGVIVRFISRKNTEAVLSQRKKLKGSGVVIVEDLTPANYRLLRVTKESKLCAQAWTKQGVVHMKYANGRIVQIRAAEDLLNQTATSSSTSPPPSRPRDDDRQRHQSWD